MSNMALQLAAVLRDARHRTLELVMDLDPGQLMGPRLPIVNPILWEIGHVAWFQERWILRRGGQKSIRGDADTLYDSSAIAHDIRCLLYTSPSPRDRTRSRMPSSA
jgi:iron(II)-dependent oxidoreductase